MRRRSDRQLRGFTLLELVLVLVVISTVLALASPSLSRFWSSAREKDAAAQILALTQWSRVQAVSEARRYRLNVDAEKGQYWVTVQDQEQFVAVASEFGRVFAVPDDMSVSLSSDGSVDGLLGGSRQSAGQSAYVEFAPDGRIEPATILLHSPRGGQMRIVCPSPTEPFRIVGAEQRREAS